MIRNLKALGLALVAVFAMSAMAASAASAATPGELTASGSVFLDGTDIATSQNALTAFGQAVECPDSSYDGHKYQGTSSNSIPVPATTFTVIPTYNNATCKTSSGLKMTVNINGCDYVFHIGETTGGVSGTYGVTADLVCTTSPGGPVTIEIFASATNENIRACTIKVPGGQNGLTGLHLTNGTAASGKKDLTLTGTIHSITAEKSGLCGSEHTTDATYHVSATITGTNAAKEPTDIEISD